MSGPRSLSSRVLAWVRAGLDAHGLRTDILGVQLLQGSTSATLYRLELSGGTAVVLRHFDVHPDWLRTEPDLARHEARSLEWAAPSTVPTPHALTYDETGESCGIPSVLMTGLPGTVELNPPEPALWLDALATTLAALHRIPPADFGWTYAPYTDLRTWRVPGWSGVPEHWAAATDRVKGPPPAFTPHFIHRDYHPANVLWQGQQVSGVVDWVNACVGPAGADVGHCMVNLAQMYGPQAAHAFRAAYERRSGQLVDSYWLLVSLIDMTDGPPRVYPGWPAFGLHGLTDTLIRERLEAYLASLIGE